MINKFWKFFLAFGFMVELQGFALASENKPEMPQTKEGISPDVHGLCLDAKDYMGCVQAQTNGIQKVDGKRRWERDNGDIVVFDPSTVRAIMVKEKFGRYLEYRYALRGIQSGTTGVYSPGVQMPSTATTNMVGSTAYTTVIPGATVGAVSIPGRPGGLFYSNWRVEVDCLDYTANWDGDSESWRNLKNIKPGESPSSKEARQVMNEFCPQMPRLVEEAQKKEN